MKTYSSIPAILLLSLLIFNACSDVEKEELHVNNLRCEMLENPEGIDALAPRLSWQITSSQRNIQQKAYQILVASSQEKLDKNEGDVWNSGKVSSNQSILVPYQGETLKSRTKYFWKVKIWSKNGKSEWSDAASWSMGQLHYKDWSGRWIGFDRDFPWEEKVQFPTQSARYFRKEFSVPSDKTIESAYAYIIGLGNYELYLNGQKVGNDVMAPAPTDYTQNVKYNTFNITSNIQNGNNAVGVILGAGRYSAMRPNYKPYKIKDFGYPKLLFNLFIKYTDGSRDVIRTDNQWKGTAQGPIRNNNEYDGEIYDATMEMPGWSKPGFDESKWLQAEYVQEPRGELEAQMNEPIRIMDSIQPISIVQLKPNVYIMDMGQNMAGWIQMKVKGQRGQKVTLRFAESLLEDGTLNTAPLRDAKATDTYILKGGGTETWHPIFTYHGFRYVEITGYPGNPKLENFEGHVVYDAMQKTGSFQTSDSLLNQIYQNAFWSINATYKGIPIDCPQRNERMPWLGDRAIGCYGESFILDNSKLYLKWLDDIRNAQKEDGCLSDVAPPFFRYYSDNMTWPGTYLFVVDMLYKQYGLTNQIAAHYPAMKKWLFYMMDRYMDDYILTKDSYGDWCEPPATIEDGRGKNANVKYPSQLISTAYLYKYLQMMQEFAALSGNQEDIETYEKIAGKVKKAFNKKYFLKEEAVYGKEKLTEQLLALAFNLVPEEKTEDVVNMLKYIIEVENNGHLSSGLIGVQWLMRVLSDYGMPDLAYKLATNTTYPSWGYMIENGATSIWELWNANIAAPQMNSQNHVMMLGDLMIWYNEYLAGIKSDNKETGFKKIIMNPIFPESLNYVNASYQSPYGKIVSNWSKTNDELKWEIRIPANCTAEVFMPTTNESNITENDSNLENIENIQINESVDNKTILEIGSGTYNFTVNLNDTIHLE